MKQLKDIKDFCQECVYTKRQSGQIQKVFNTFCRVHGLESVTLHLTGKATYKSYNMREKSNGYYRSDTKEIVVKVNENIEKTLRTLIHELVHAYQDAYMNDMFNYGRKQKQVYGLKEGYWDSVHEQHARLCAQELIALLKRNDFQLRRVFNSYSLESAVYRINCNALAV